MLSRRSACVLLASLLVFSGSSDNLLRSVFVIFISRSGSAALECVVAEGMTCGSPRGQILLSRTCFEREQTSWMRGVCLADEAPTSCWLVYLFSPNPRIIRG